MLRSPPLKHRDKSDLFIALILLVLSFDLLEPPLTY
jgi:hypothetical protein